MIHKLKGNITVPGRMRIIPFTIALIFSAAVVQAQHLAGGLSNGRSWRIMKNEEKLTYMIGFHEGVSTTAAVLRQAQPKKLVHRLNIGEIVSQMDKFYEDSANSPVPISWGFLYAVKKANGATEAELQTFLSGLRKSAASALKVK